MNDLEQEFPGLKEDNYRPTSPADVSYNCVAYAAGDETRCWDPTSHQYYWPPRAPRTVRVDSYVAAFSTLGYEPCESHQLEHGFEKVAIFWKEARPTHAARQLPSGRWTSKLGDGVDIEHDLHAIEGDAYGQVVVLMKRPRTEA